MGKDNKRLTPALDLAYRIAEIEGNYGQVEAFAQRSADITKVIFGDSSLVLSACESATGEVATGEGVYGLQRAFLVAGAKSIIISLFKVSDTVTEELMAIFYKRWVETGDKRGAFIYAKKQIREKYQQSNYWSPFIMMGV